MTVYIPIDEDVLMVNENTWLNVNVDNLELENNNLLLLDGDIFTTSMYKQKEKLYSIQQVIEKN